MHSTAPPFIYLDAGFTLIHPWPSVGAIYAEFAIHAGFHGAEASVLDRTFRTAWRQARSAALLERRLPYGTTEEEARDFWYGVIRDTLRLAGLPVPFQESFYSGVFEGFADARHWRVFPGALVALREARSRGVPLGVLSNWDARLHRILEGLELRELFDVVLLSCDVGAEKPDPAIYAEAARRAAALTAATPSMIGDEPEADGFGARGAGWSQCLVLREGAVAPEGLRGAPSLPLAMQALLSEWE